MTVRKFLDNGGWSSLALLGVSFGCGPSAVNSSEDLVATGGGTEATATMMQTLEGSDPDAPLVPDWVKQTPVPPGLVKFVGFLKEAYPVASFVWSFLDKGPTLAGLLDQMKQDIIDEVRRLRNDDLRGDVEALINLYTLIGRNPNNATTRHLYALWIRDFYSALADIRGVINGPDVQGAYDLIVPLNVLVAMHLTMLRGNAEIGVEPFDDQSRRDVLREMKQINYDFVGHRWTYFAITRGGPWDSKTLSTLWKSKLFAGASGAGRCEQRMVPFQSTDSPKSCAIDCNLLTEQCGSSCGYARAELNACLNFKRSQVSAKFDTDRVVIAAQRALNEIIYAYPDPIANVGSPIEGDATLAAPVFRADEAPIAVSSAGTRVDVLYNDTSSKLTHTSFVNNQPGMQSGYSQESSFNVPAARAVGSDLFWGFYLGPNSSIYQYTRAGANAVATPVWRGVPPTAGLNLAGQMTDSPAVTPTNSPVLVATGADRQPWINTWDGTHWAGWWQHRGVALQSSPVAVSPEPGRLDYFGTEMGGGVAHGSLTAAGSRMSVLERGFGGLAATSWGANRIDLFGVGEDRAVWHRYWNGSDWSQWRSLGGMVTSKPAVVAWGPGRIDVFARGTDAALWHAWCDGQGCDSDNWIGWEYMGGYMLGNPVVTSAGPGKLAVFVHGGGNGLYRKVFDGGWQPSLQGYDPVASDVLTRTDRGIFRLELEEALGKCLNVNGGGTADGTNILQWHCNGTGAQAFELQSVGNHLYRLVNTNSHKCVEVDRRVTAEGANVQLGTCDGTAVQAFSLQRVSDSSDSVRLINLNGKCVEVAWPPQGAGSNVQVGTCRSEASSSQQLFPALAPVKSQLWKLVRI